MADPRLAAALLAAMLATLPAVAEERAAGDHTGTFTPTSENDLFAGTDRYHASGFQLAWRTSSDDPPAWLAGLAQGGVLF